MSGCHSAMNSEDRARNPETHERRAKRRDEAKKATESEWRTRLDVYSYGRYMYEIID